MKLAVTIDVDGDIMYVPENTHGFVNFPKPKPVSYTHLTLPTNREV